MATSRPLPVVAPRDVLDRPLRDLRISVTDRCNFRCRYCMPREAFGPDFRFLDKPLILSFEEISELASTFVELGVKKLRLTGGEPLLRRQLDVLIAKLSQLDCDLALTTNGSLLAREADALRRAGLNRLTVSVDSLDPDTFSKITDGGVALSSVLNGIDRAQRAGFADIRINTVVRRGVNEGELLSIARYFNERGHTVRFIEFMDVGQTNGWNRKEVVSADRMLETLRTELELEPLESRYPGEVARRYRVSGGRAEIGFITSVTQPFCGACTRARLSAEGSLYTCLFAGRGRDLRGPLRSGATREELKQLIRDAWQARNDRYSEARNELRPLRRIEMSYIGG